MQRLACLLVSGVLAGLALAACDSDEPAPDRLAGSAPRPTGSARAKHVLLVVADTLRADRLGCYGYERDTSPTIDALAEGGTLYENSHSQACWTLPSMISLMAGVPVTERETALPAVPVLAETLQAAGFTTAAFLANNTVGVDRGFERGFDHFGEAFNFTAPAVVEEFEAWHSAWRAEAGEGDRFFAWVHFIDPHHPYAPDAQDDVYSGVGPQRAGLEPLWRAAASRVPALSPDLVGKDTERAVRMMQAISNRYDGEVRAVDRGVERLLDVLRASGDLEDTLIVFCADHGEMLYEQENFPSLVQSRIEAEGGLPDGVADLFAAGHRPWYYEDLWRTPLIFSGPGFEGGGRRGGLAANLDIYPTVLEALGVERLSFLRGESLLGAREPERTQVFAYGHYTTAVLDRDGTKLIVNLPRLFLSEDEEHPPLQMFDLGRDPDEHDNLARTQVERVRGLLAAIDEWRSENERQVIGTTTERAREALRQMGYIEDYAADSDE